MKLRSRAAEANGEDRSLVRVEYGNIRGSDRDRDRDRRRPSTDASPSPPARSKRLGFGGYRAPHSLSTNQQPSHRRPPTHFTAPFTIKTAAQPSNTSTPNAGTGTFASSADGHALYHDSTKNFSTILSLFSLSPSTTPSLFNSGPKLHTYDQRRTLVNNFFAFSFFFS